MVFGGTGLFLVPWMILYATTTDEPAGALLLAACSVALFVITGYFELQARRIERRPSDEDVAVEAPATVEAPEPAAHGPEMSVWPLLMAGAATLLGFGLAFTVWVAIPAGLMLAVGVYGYAREV
jgi:hypothetical protein